MIGDSYYAICMSKEMLWIDKMYERFANSCLQLNPLKQLHVFQISKEFNLPIDCAARIGLRFGDCTEFDSKEFQKKIANSRKPMQVGSFYLSNI